jgi:hypothetical protein
MTAAVRMSCARLKWLFCSGSLLALSREKLSTSLVMTRWWLAHVSIASSAAASSR